MLDKCDVIQYNIYCKVAKRLTDVRTLLINLIKKCLTNIIIYDIIIIENKKRGYYYEKSNRI